jgi:hypothetical protein
MYMLMFISLLLAFYCITNKNIFLPFIWKSAIFANIHNNK